MFRFYSCDFQDGSHNHLWLQNPSGSAVKESACNAGDPSSIPGFRKIPLEKGYPLQYSGLENSMDCVVQGVAKSRTRLSDFHYGVLECGLSELGCAVNVKCTLDSKYLAKIKNMQNILVIIFSVLHVNILEILWKIKFSLNLFFFLTLFNVYWKIQNYACSSWNKSFYCNF